MNEYELLYIVSSAFTDEELSTIEGAVGDMFTKVGIAGVKSERLGKFHLAYPVKRQEYGHYVLARFQAETPAIADLNNLLRLSPDKVLRHLILRADEVGDEKYTLIPFQPVNVESREDRARKPRRAEAAAAVEGATELVTDAKAVDTLTEEDVDKKINEALESKA
ncbi:MAG: hypothetical protein RL141_401 [Candidatus Parcubacteria bacterium]|jgi:small subunit ribosomal protein S6